MIPSRMDLFLLYQVLEGEQNFRFSDVAMALQTTNLANFKYSLLLSRGKRLTSKYRNEFNLTVFCA